MLKQNFKTALALGILCALGCATASRDTLERSVDRALAAGDTTRAEKLLQTLVGRPDATPERFVQLGEIHQRKETIRDRLVAHRVLTEGVQRHPNDPSVLFALGKIYYLRTFYPDAQGCFEKVLRMQPDHCMAAYYLGLNAYRKWKHVQVWHDDLGDAQNFFGRVVACDPSHVGAFYRYAFTTYALDDSTAADVCQDLVTRHGEHARTLFLMGAMDYESQRYDESSLLFERALDLLPESERALYLDISIVLDEEDNHRYADASRKVRDEIERVFWAERDPDPTTQLNERRMEHLYRMFLSDEYFAHSRLHKRGWDTERGISLVKFGWPADVHSTLAGGPLTGRMEIWDYPATHGFMQIVFRDEFLNGNYIVPISSAYSSFAQTLFLDEPTTEIVPASIQIPGTSDVVAFRGEESIDMYLALRIDSDSLANTIPDQVYPTFIARSAIYDDTWQAEYFEEDTLKISTRRESVPRPWIDVYKHYEVSFDEHWFAYSFQDDIGIAQALVKTRVDARRLLSETLITSDLLFYHPERPKTTSGSITRGDTTLFARASSDFSDEDNVNVYLEIYNLLTRQNRAEYSISYSIYPADPANGRWQRLKRGIKRILGGGEAPLPVITQTFTRRADASRSAERLAINVAIIPQGEYRLQVDVEDKLNGATTTHAKRFTR